MTKARMFKKILTANQVELLPLIKEFSRDYYLAGGTAIALQLGQRRSLDFDLFTCGRIKRQSLKRLLDHHKYPVSTRNSSGNNSATFRILTIPKKWIFSRKLFQMMRSNDS